MGSDLQAILKIQRLTDEQMQLLVYQILRGLKYVHSANVNILLIYFLNISLLKYYFTLPKRY